jgi:sigma-E factor negative regulatory protein RseB
MSLNLAYRVEVLPTAEPTISVAAPAAQETPKTAMQSTLQEVQRSNLWFASPLVAASFFGSTIAAAQLAPSVQPPQFGPGAPPSVAAPEAAGASQVLRQAAQAASMLNYTGTILYSRRGAAETSRIVHLFENGVEMERITTLDGPPFEVVRTNEELTCYLPESRLMWSEPRTGRQGFPSLLPRQMSTLAQHFSVKKLEIERVAGHEAQVWLFEPNDEFRFWHKLWTELKTGMWLRGRVIDEKGNTIEEITFTDIKIGGKIDREQVKPTLASSISNWRKERKLPLSATKAETGWFARNAPAGFVKISETFMRSLPGRTEPVSQLVYSDGLTSVSVYAATVSPGQPISEGASVQGAHQIFARQVGDSLVTAFGDARPGTVKAIASSMNKK